MEDYPPLVQIQCETNMGPVTICLGVVLIVANLGASCLIGEPVKHRKNIVCLPRQKLVIFASGQEAKYTNYAENHQQYTLVRAVTTTSILADESAEFHLPDFLRQEPVVNVVPRPSWLQPSMIQPSWGKTQVYILHSVPVF